jgi:hypothetical protein
MEDWLKEYVVTVKLQTDVKLEALRTLKFWEGQTHSDCSPFFLVTEVMKIEEMPEEIEDEKIE